MFGVLDRQLEASDRGCTRRLVGDRGDVSLRGVGTTTALVGSTGSGKTALAYLVTRLCGPSVRGCGEGPPRDHSGLARRQRRPGVKGDLPVPFVGPGQPALAPGRRTS